MNYIDTERFGLIDEQDAPKNHASLHIVAIDQYAGWLAQAPAGVQQHLKILDKDPCAGHHDYVVCDGDMYAIVFCANDSVQDNVATIAGNLPSGIYQPHLYMGDDISLDDIAFAWAMGCYQYRITNRDSTRNLPKLCLRKDSNVMDEIQAHFLVRDLINMPPNILNPAKFAAIAQQMFDASDVAHETIYGDELLAQNFPLIHAVGRASDSTPHLFRASFGNPDHPKIAIVGKGVCFDTGGINIKGASNMLLMKKDMGGAAIALGIAWLLYKRGVKLRVELFLPLVENAISANAYRPSDVLEARNGMTIEVGDTDAEGRLVLADCLACASEAAPQFILDCATLTGAARVAMGLDVPAFFSNDQKIGNQLQEIGRQNGDLLWQLPLHQGYLKSMRSKVADISSTGTSGYGGAITAALFLQHFVANIPWIHVDMMAWSVVNQGMKSIGGSSTGLRSLYEVLRDMQSK